MSFLGFLNTCFAFLAFLIVPIAFVAVGIWFAYSEQCDTSTDAEKIVRAMNRQSHSIAALGIDLRGLRLPR